MPSFASETKANKTKEIPRTDMDQRVTYHAKVNVLANNHINTRPACQPVDLMDGGCFQLASRASN